MVYGIFTAGQRTWGGPRADAGTADATTSPQAAIEHAEATGDDLNIVPETFRSAALSRHFSNQLHDEALATAQLGRRAGRSVWYPDADALLPLSLHRRATVPPRIPLQPRASTESLMSEASATFSIAMPRRVESFFDLENQNPRQSVRAHPPSAQSAFYERRRDARLSQQSFQSHMRLGPEEGADLGEVSRASLLNEDIGQHASDIPLLELSRPTSPESSKRPSLQVYEYGAGRRGRSSLARSFSAQDLENSKPDQVQSEGRY